MSAPVCAPGDVLVHLRHARDHSGNWIVLVEPRAFTPEDFV